MSRLDPVIAEENRLAWNKALVVEKYDTDLAAWLHANPEVGMLNGGKFYTYTTDRVYKEIAAFTKL
jgi:hypothetical protein